MPDSSLLLSKENTSIHVKHSTGFSGTCTGPQSSGTETWGAHSFHKWLMRMKRGEIPEMQVEEHYAGPQSCQRHSKSKPQSSAGLGARSPPQAHQNAEAAWLLSWRKDGMPVPGRAAGSHLQSQWVKHDMLPARGREASPNTEGGASPVPKKPRGRSRQQEQQTPTKALWNMKGRNK